MNVPLLPRSPRKASESRARTGAPAEEYRVMVFDNFDTDVKRYCTTFGLLLRIVTNL